MERAGWKPNVEMSPSCPRCGSSNTKFCYYNNYSLTQPRYFCKGCRRYWTKGGSLRNVPMGGGCRKNRRGRSIRLSTDIMSSKSTGFRGLSNHPLGLSHGSSSSTGPPNIDLALVYANFLNPQPPGSENSSGSEPQEPTSSNGGLSMVPSVLSGMTNGPDSSIGLLEAGNGCIFGWESLSDLFVDNHLGKGGNTPIFDHPTIIDSLQASHHSTVIQQCGTDDMSYYVLPPLPNEDIVLSQEMTAPWSVTHPLVVEDHSLQAPELPVLGPDHQAQADQDPNLLITGS
ncbi:hypothetical protein CDL15_Pgr003199 [Punica granatum]|nr:hypothetical protein CDL15_Pgr003199 [Punica granatum]